VINCIFFYVKHGKTHVYQLSYHFACGAINAAAATILPPVAFKQLNKGAAVP
jgi:hypothetical protein